jgi:hypothetical protein
MDGTGGDDVGSRDPKWVAPFARLRGGRVLQPHHIANALGDHLQATAAMVEALALAWEDRRWAPLLSRIRGASQLLTDPRSYVARRRVRGPVEGDDH